MDFREQLIVEGLRSGDEDAYRFLFDHYYRPLCATATMYLGDHYEAESVVADVIFHVWQIRETLEIHTSLKAFLARAVRNRCLDFLKQQYLQHETRRALGDDEALQPADMNSYPLRQLIDQELGEAIDKAIAELPEQTRQVLIMSRIDGLKREEIAQRLGISVNTVKYHLKSAIGQLSDKLGRYVAVMWIFNQM